MRNNSNSPKQNRDMSQLTRGDIEVSCPVEVAFSSSCGLAKRDTSLCISISYTHRSDDPYRAWSRRKCLCVYVCMRERKQTNGKGRV